MKKVKLYIAMSLDGFIAKKNGDVQWLSGDSDEMEMPSSYFKFIETVDTVIMGYNTYEQITQVLSPEKWAYTRMDTYVITHREMEDKENIFFRNESIKTLIPKMREKGGKDIWICGGANIVNQCIKENFVDIYTISVIPVLLGDGIELFSKGNIEKKLKLTHTDIYNGIVDLTYTKNG